MQGSRSGGLLFLWAFFWAGAAAAAIALVLFSVPPETLFYLSRDAVLYLSLLLVPCLIVPAFVVLAVLSVDAGPSAVLRGELDRLVQWKREGGLLPRSRPRRGSLVPARPPGPSTEPLRGSDSPQPIFLEGDLDRLVQLKRQGAWFPRAATTSDYEDDIADTF